MKDTCADENGDDVDLQDCEEILIDTFGGHTKAVFGFKVIFI